MDLHDTEYRMTAALGRAAGTSLLVWCAIRALVPDADGSRLAIIVVLSGLIAAGLSLVPNVRRPRRVRRARQRGRLRRLEPAAADEAWDPASLDGTAFEGRMAIATYLILRRQQADRIAHDHPAAVRNAAPSHAEIRMPAGAGKMAS